MRSLVGVFLVVLAISALVFFVALKLDAPRSTRRRGRDEDAGNARDQRPMPDETECDGPLPQYTQPHGELLSQYIRETLQGLRDQFDLCVKYGDKDQACHVRDQYNAFCAKLDTIGDGRQKDSTHAERGALSAMWDAIKDALVKTVDATVGKMTGMRMENVDKKTESGETQEERADRVMEKRTRELFDALVRNGQIKSSPSGTSSTGGDTIGLDRLTAGSFTGPDTPPPISTPPPPPPPPPVKRRATVRRQSGKDAAHTLEPFTFYTGFWQLPSANLYSPVPPEQTDTTFMNEMKQPLEQAFQEAGISVEFRSSRNGPYDVAFEIVWNQDGLDRKIEEAIEHAGRTVQCCRFCPNGIEHTALLCIERPKPREVNFRRLLELTDPDEVTRMASPYLVGESEEGNPVWVDLGKHGFMGGRIGKTAHICAGITAALHFKKPSEIVYLAYSDLQNEYSFLWGTPYCLCDFSKRESALQNLRRVNAEIARRRKLFRQKGRVHTLADYNARVRAEGQPQNTLPQIQVITDNFLYFVFHKDEEKAQVPFLIEEILHIIEEGTDYGVSCLCSGQMPNEEYEKIDQPIRSKCMVCMQSGDYDYHEGSRPIFGCGIPIERLSPGRYDVLLRVGEENIQRVRGAYAGKGEDDELKKLTQYCRQAAAQG